MFIKIVVYILLVMLYNVLRSKIVLKGGNQMQEYSLKVKKGGKWQSSRNEYTLEEAQQRVAELAKVRITAKIVSAKVNRLDLYGIQ